MHEWGAVRDLGRGAPRAGDERGGRGLDGRRGSALPEYAEAGGKAGARAKVIAVVNQKGGVAKTTTVLNLGDALAEVGQRVLLVDLDPQAQLADALGVVTEDPETGDLAVPATTAEVMIERAKMEEAVVGPEGQAVGDSRVDCAPARLELDDFEFLLKRRVAREGVLDGALDRVRGEYDWILVDCKPALTLLEMNAMFAADGLIVPITPEKLPLHATQRLLEAYEEVLEVRPNLRILGALLTKVDQRTNLTKNARETLAGVFEERGGVFQTEIRYNVRLAETPAYSGSALLSAPDSQGAHDYRALAREVMERG